MMFHMDVYYPVNKMVYNVLVEGAETMFVIAVTNNKGGVGKTTSTIQYAHLIAMAKPKSRVLIIDLDPQSHAARSLGVSHLIPDQGGFGIENVLLDQPLHDNLLTPRELVSEFLSSSFTTEYALNEDMVRTLVNGRHNLYLLPSSPRLELITEELSRKATSRLARSEGFSLDTVLADTLTDALTTYTDQLNHSVAPGFDYVVIDCPPKLDVLKPTVYNFADIAVVPVKVDALSFDGAQRHTSQLATMRQQEPNLIRTRLHTVLPTMMPSHKQIHVTDVYETMIQFYGASTVAQPINELVEVKEAPAHGLTLYEYSKVIRKQSRALASYARAVRSLL
jgi:chromosome partitioning protein